MLLLDRGAVKFKVQKQSNGDRLIQQTILLTYNPAITSQGIAALQHYASRNLDKTKTINNMKLKRNDLVMSIVNFQPTPV